MPSAQARAGWQARGRGAGGQRGICSLRPSSNCLLAAQHSMACHGWVALSCGVREVLRMVLQVCSGRTAAMPCHYIYHGIHVHASAPRDTLLCEHIVDGSESDENALFEEHERPPLRSLQVTQARSTSPAPSFCCERATASASTWAAGAATGSCLTKRTNILWSQPRSEQHIGGVLMNADPYARCSEPRKNWITPLKGRRHPSVWRPQLRPRS